jgi:putative oxidoreductase
VCSRRRSQRSFTSFWPSFRTDFFVTGNPGAISAVWLLVASLARFGALPLAVTMVGAILTHLFIIGGNPAVPIALLAATTTIAWARSRD